MPSDELLQLTMNICTCVNSMCRADPDFDEDPTTVYYNVYDPADHKLGKKGDPLPIPARLLVQDEKELSCSSMGDRQCPKKLKKSKTS